MFIVVAVVIVVENDAVVIDPRNLNLRFAEILGPKTWVKRFWFKTILSPKMLGPKNVRQKNFGLQIILSQKNFWVEKNKVQKMFDKNMGSENCLIKQMGSKKFGSKKSWVETILGNKIWLKKICC